MVPMHRTVVSSSSAPLRVLAVGLSALAVAIAGCGPGAGPTVSLTSDDPAGRIPAMKQAARSKDADAIPRLVELLESDDPAERFYAIEALRRITGKTMGFTYYGTEEERAEAVGRWKTEIGKESPPTSN